MKTLIKKATEKGFKLSDNEDFDFMYLCELQKWLRDNHNIDIVVRKDWDDGKLLGYEFCIEEDEGLWNSEIFTTYELALEASLSEALTLINQLGSKTPN